MNTIKHLRTAVLQINQDAMAKAAGVTQPTVSRWETGELSPSMDEIQNICKAYPTIKPAAFFAEAKAS